MARSALLLRLLLLLNTVPCLIRADGLLCTEKSPIQSNCTTENDPLCGPVEFDDFKVVSCPEKMLFTTIKVEAEKEMIGNDLLCDRKTGKWGKLMHGGGRKALKPIYNIFCQYDDCNMTKWTSDCGSDEDCVKYKYANFHFSCKSPAKIWSGSKDESDWKKLDADHLRCWRGVLYPRHGGSNGEPIAEGLEVRCRNEYIPKEEGGLPVQYWILIGVGSILVFLAVIFWLILRKTGTSWITVAFGKDSKPAEINYDFDAHSRPSNTPKMGSPQSPGVLSPMKQQSAEVEAEVKPAEVKVAAPPSATIATSHEKVTVTEDMASKEKVSAEKIVFRV